MGWNKLLGPVRAPGPLPRVVLRHLLTDHRIGIGSRVLDVGCGHGDLVHVLDDLGIEAIGLDESAENVIWAKELEPRSDFHLVAQPVEVTLEHFGDDEPVDLIVVRHLTTYDGDLLSPCSLRATARLLQHLCVGGSMVFLVHREEDSDEKSEHNVSCFARHLSLFPGTCRVKHFVDCEFTTRASDWLHGRTHTGEIVMISLEIPSQPIATEAWLAHADEALKNLSVPCCAWATFVANRAA